MWRAETGLVDSYRQALRHMYEVGEPLRTEQARADGDRSGVLRGE
ncbi:hypothetical protein [Streptomyces sp. NPDC003483]